MELTHFVDMVERAKNDAGHGALWGTESEDLDCTLVAWPEGRGVTASVNDEVDVAMIIVEGHATVRIDDDEIGLSSGQVVIIEKGCRREIRATSPRLVYLNVHKRRKRLGLSSIDRYRSES